MTTWSDLLPDLLEKIAGEVGFYEDFISFLCVCSSWRSSARGTKNFSQLLPSRYPSLMLPESKTDQETVQHRKLFLLSNGGMIREVQLPEAHGQRCVSSRGWLLMTGEEEFAAKLLHPLSGTQVDLPELYMFPEYHFDQDEWIYYGHCMRKVVLTSSNLLSASESFRVIIIWGNTIGVCRPGDGSWSCIGNSCWDGKKLYDITYHKERKRLYVLANMGSVYEGDITSWSSSCPPALDLLSVLPKEEFGCTTITWAYLLEWGHDGLLMITREWKHYKRNDDEFQSYGPYRTKGFQAFVFGLDDGKWSKIESLGNRAVFVGFNSTFSVSVSDDKSPVKANCIYFTDDLYEPYRGLPRGGGRDTGVYHMSDGSIRPLFDQQESFSHIGSPLWLESSIPPCINRI